MPNHAQEVIVCPICGNIIHSRMTTPIVSRATVSSRDYAAASAQLTAMAIAAEATHREMILAAEEACNEHFRAEHPWRLWAWKKLKWERLMNRRWFFFGQRFNYEQFEVHP